MTMYEIQFKNGVTLVMSDRDTMVQYVNGGDVMYVVIRGSMEIVFDARIGWA